MLMTPPTRWLNATGAPVKVYDSAGKVVLNLDPAGVVNTGTTTTRHVWADLDGLTLVERLYVPTEDLPKPAPGVGVIVSPQVARTAAADREDLWQPYELLPDTDDGAISCRGLLRDVSGSAT